MPDFLAKTQRGLFKQCHSVILLASRMDRDSIRTGLWSVPFDRCTAISSSIFAKGDYPAVNTGETVLKKRYDLHFLHFSVAPPMAFRTAYMGLIVAFFTLTANFSVFFFFFTSFCSLDTSAHLQTKSRDYRIRRIHGCLWRLWSLWRLPRLGRRAIGNKGHMIRRGLKC